VIDVAGLMMWTWFDTKYAFFNPDLNHETLDHCLIIGSNQYCMPLKPPYEHVEQGTDATLVILNLFRFGFFLDMVGWASILVGFTGQFISKSSSTKARLLSAYAVSIPIILVIRLFWIIYASHKRGSQLGQVVCGNFMTE
jgi:hypothetical protein